MAVLCGIIIIKERLSMRFYNTLTNKLEEFHSIEEKQITMYVCGATIYDDIHIGNARPIIFFDTLRRFFEFSGYEVNYVSNITDIDDKIIARAQLNGISEAQLTKKYEKALFDVYSYLGATPSKTPCATAYLNEMIAYVKNLLEKGYAYLIEDDGVYFSVDKVADYGILSNQKTQNLLEGTRGILNQNKKCPLDFSLWKLTKDNGIKYNSPWGLGRPGWHTECAVINKVIFKKEIDIHGGGSDLRFPHHENEIAQTYATDCHYLARFFMHVGRLDFLNEKMSKSVGNVVYVKDFINDGIHPFVLRFLLLNSSYRQPINYSSELLEQSIIETEKYRLFLKKNYFKLVLNSVNIQNDLENIDSRQAVTITKFLACLEDDFNVTNALMIINKTIKELNANRSFIIENLEIFKNKYLDIIVMLNILGLFDIESLKCNDDDLQNYTKWTMAKEAKDFILADEYRKLLVQKELI